MTTKSRKYDISRGEARSLCEIAGICAFLHVHSVLPSIHSEVEEERRLAHKLHNLRYAKTGKNDMVFHRSFDALAKRLGVPRLFSATTSQDRQRKQLRDVKAVVQVLRASGGKGPSHGSHDPEIRRLGEFMHNLRSVARRKSSGRVYPETTAYLESVGMKLLNNYYL
jgi:hypothetical protein